MREPSSMSPVYVLDVPGQYREKVPTGG